MVVPLYTSTSVLSSDKNDDRNILFLIIGLNSV